MDILNTTIDFSINFSFVVGLFLCFIAAIVSYVSYPVIIRVSNEKGLMATPNQRDVHTFKTPNLGGIGIFFAISLIISFIGNYFQNENVFHLLGALTVMFFIGLVDDLIDISPKSKFIGQILVSLSIILLTDIRVESLHGIFGIYELPYIISTIITVLVFVTIINAYNLIDGVDGLAGTFAITANLFFSCFYFFNENYFMFFLSIGMIGALISFLMFNFSKKSKIFMGDTGSMVVGFLLAYQAVYLSSVEFNSTLATINPKLIIYVMAIFSFPILDTARVFVIRLKAGKSPFSADNNHIHHALLSFGLKHWEISVATSMFTISIIFGVFLCNNLGVNEMLLSLIAMWLFSIMVISNINLLGMLANLNINLKNTTESNFENVMNNKEGEVIQLKKLA
jgi:UDP-N-acetylmuramyl pentapeptide phosphotransferase/UDP-N-acetylglucosamine-1-phosphate transferase